MAIHTDISTSVKKGRQPSVIVNAHDVHLCLKTNFFQKDCFHVGPLTFNIFSNEILGVVGPSGSGKTTLLRVIAGLEIPKEGSITIDSKKVFDRSIFVPAENRRVGMMFQDHALFPHMNVRNNILFGIKHWKKDDRQRRLYELERLLNLQGYLNRYPHELSGGQQQRVALARTLAPNPTVILLDEPLSNIDAELRDSLAQELKNVLKRTSATAIWVTHDQTEALDLADRILVLNNGQIEQIDAPWKLYNQPKTRFVADFIGHAVFIKGLLKNDAILTEIGTVPCPPCLKNNQQFELMIRPDDIKASPHDGGIGTVIKRQYLGSVQLYSIQLPSGNIVLSNQPSHINWPIGTQLRIDLAVRSVVAFPH